MSIYFDSFEAELKDSSDLEANIFHKAKKEFIDAQRMVLTVEDNFITASKIESIRDRLLKIFQDRFGYYVDISVEYVRERKSRQAEYAEETFQREVDTIVKNYAEAEAAVKQKEEKLRLLDNPDMVLPTARANRQIALTSALDNQESRLLVSEKTGEPLQIWQAAFWRKEEPKEILRKFFERIEEDL